MDREPVDPEEWLYRRSWLPEKKYLNPDGTATSRVFKLRANDYGELSVDAKSLTTPQNAIGDETKFFLFELANSSVLSISDPQLKTLHDPLPDGKNDAHAVIVGMNMEDEITPSLLAKASRKVNF